MGNRLLRLVLAPGMTSAAALDFARQLRQSHPRPSTINFRTLRNRSVRKPEFLAAKDVDVSIIDPKTTATYDLLIAAAKAAFGESKFLLRDVDDDEIDFCYPELEWLNRTYSGSGLQWLLDAEESAPWETSVYFATPNNPPNWDETVPLVAALFRVAQPGQARPCPICDSVYTSRATRGQCSVCGFVATPFTSRAEAFTSKEVPLDAANFGRCVRCRSLHEFTARVGQCRDCGQLLVANTSKHRNQLVDNRAAMESLIRTLY